ncbi:MAG: TlpA family protein disulfide reductase [Verrucomicrobiales bacterium]|jgi:thiol-disulfide isomerase/thioredoxin|nr:TlpA family protein disulfide reductase [Verrucomicrobiales bacterium]MBP9224714.1 TlpA family protein disulfide reductase [Verrucomicrobiales bacterium]
MKKLTCCLGLLFTLSSLHAQKAMEIAATFEKQKIEAIEAYLKETPDAADKDQALAILVGAHMSMGQFEPIPDLLSQRYDAQETGADANLQLVMTEIARPFIEASIVSNQRDKAKAFITRLKSDFSTHAQSAQVNQFLDQMGGELYLPGVGDEMAIAFTDLAGKEIDLSTMKDKVILVDFWATWCGPCVAEMPNVIAAYEEHHKNGFEVVGISLDEDKSAVEKFVSDKKMPWPQYFDGKGWENEIAQKYGIRSIPATFLVGKGGKIIGANLRGPELEAAVKKALTAAN